MNSTSASNPLQQTIQDSSSQQQRQESSTRGSTNPAGTAPVDSTPPPPGFTPGARPVDDIAPFGESQEHVVPGEAVLPPLEGDDQEQIRSAAYDRYVKGGYQEGSHLEHWLDAEREWRNRRS